MNTSLAIILVLLLSLIVLSVVFYRYLKVRRKEKLSLEYGKRSLEKRERQLHHEKNMLDSRFEKEMERVKRANKLYHLLTLLEILPSDLIGTLTIEEDQEYWKYKKRIHNYVSRLKTRLEKRRSLLIQKPLVSRAAPQIAKLTAAERLKQEYHICKQKMADENLIIPTWDKVVCDEIRVIDGDTFDVKVGDARFIVRGVGYDSPEVCHPRKDIAYWGPESSLLCRNIVEKASLIELCLDKEQRSQRWVYDRYGRLLAHIYIDGELLGAKMIMEGSARVVTFFPCEDAIKNSYLLLEDLAKNNNKGMWEYLNKLNSKKQPLDFADDVVNTETLIGVYQEGIKRSFQELIGMVFHRSKNSSVLHHQDCSYLKTVRNPNREEFELTADNIQTVRACKRCDGDPMVKELLE